MEQFSHFSLDINLDTRMSNGVYTDEFPFIKGKHMLTVLDLMFQDMQHSKA